MRQERCKSPLLETELQPRGDAAGGGDGGPGEKAGEIDHVDFIGEVLTIDLKPHWMSFVAAKDHSDRRVERYQRKGPIVGEVYPVENGLPVLRSSFLISSVEIDRQAAVISSANRRP